MTIHIKRRADGTAKIRRDGYSNQETDWWTIRNAVFKRDGGVCQSRTTGSRCGQPGKEVHHVIRLSAGGTTTMGNLITLCASCHDQRHTGHTIRRADPAKKVARPWGRAPKLKPYRP